MTDQNLITEFLALPRYAVVGVSADRKKYGYKIWRSLREKGYTVYPINPRYDDIEGERCYRSLAEVAEDQEQRAFLHYGHLSSRRSTEHGWSYLASSTTGTVTVKCSSPRCTSRTRALCFFIRSEIALPSSSE